VNTYEFSLVFDTSAVAGEADDLVEALGEHGCDDAIVGIGRVGRLALDFDREAPDAVEAVLSAVRDVIEALPGAVLVEASPDFVGITEVADIVGRSRQNIRKLLLSGASPSPAPVHEGSPSLWHLEDILIWLGDRKGYEIDDDLLDLARVTKQLNLASSLRQLDSTMRADLEAMLA
jgi:hypothetical protein